MGGVGAEREGAGVKIPELELPPRAEVGAYVYFMRCESPDLQVKIGYAKDLAGRLSGVRTSNPYPVRVLTYFWTENFASVEKQLHDRFAQHRIRREWFCSTPDIEKLIADIRLEREEHIRRTFSAPTPAASQTAHTTPPVRTKRVKPTTPTPDPSTFVWRGKARKWSNP